MSKKRVGIIIAVVAAAAAAAAAGIWHFFPGKGGSGEDKVYVEAVSSLNTVSIGAQNRYSGVVEPQETWEVNKNAERQIKERLVEEGDVVEVGTPLFVYDTEDLEAEIAQAKLDLEGMQNEISNYQNQIKQLSEEKKTAPEDEKFQYTSQIQSLQNSIKQTEYNIEGKKIEIEKKQQSIEKSTVTSEIAGVVKSINESGINDMTGESAAYMTILATGQYRVKGLVSEQNVGMLTEGQPVIIRSRIDEEQTWNGTIGKIDIESQENNSGNQMMYDGGGSMETSSKYPFYVSMEGTDGLILGQHVYIELDEGQAEVKEGIWLFEGYLCMDEKQPYVWTSNSKNKLEKRVVELGEYDENMCEYQIISGLTSEDYIAFPMAGFYEGITTVTDAKEVDYSSPLYNQGADMEDGMTEDGMLEDGMTEDGMTEDGILEDGMTEGGTLEDGMTENGMVESEMPEDGMPESEMPSEELEGE